LELSRPKRVWERKHVTVWGGITPLCHCQDEIKQRVRGQITPKQLKYQDRICEKCLAILKGDKK
jgi:hypothetical protein